MNDLMAYELPLEPDVKNPFFSSIAAAVRWLETQPPEDMTGDDSVGWWLLMEVGKYPPKDVLEILSTRLNSLTKGQPLKIGVLYTFTAIARTLKRAGFPLDTIPKLHKTWHDAIERSIKAQCFDMNHVWLLQMGTEIWPESTRRYSKNVQDLIKSDDYKGLIPTTALILMKSLNIQMSPKVRNSVLAPLDGILKDETIEEIPDWNIAYMMWAMLVCGKLKNAKEGGNVLLARQIKGAWDESSEECIESTSICGLAMLDLSIALINTKNRTAARSRALHEIMMLMDRYNWLLHRWQGIQEMPKNQEKGWAFESFIQEWVSSEKSVEIYGTNLRGGIDELDIVLDVSKHPTLSNILKSSQFVLIECKHTTNPVKSIEVRAFRDSLRQRRKENCQLGVYISSAGFSSGAEKAIKEDLEGNQNQIILLLTGKDVENALRQRHELSTLLVQKMSDRVIRRP